MAKNGVSTVHHENDKKVFVGGLHIDASESDVRNHFSQFGEVLKADIKFDPISGRSRGFAFVAYASQDGANKAIAQATHTIRGKTVDVKRVKPPAPNCKIFIGGIKPDITVDDIRDHFDSLGGASDIEVPMDRLRNHHKGFCFVTLHSEETVNHLVQQGKIIIKGVPVEVRKATPKSTRMQQQPQQQPMNAYSGGYGGGGGGGGGGYGAGGNGFDSNYGYGGFDYSAYGYGGAGVNYGAGYGAQAAGYGAAGAAGGGPGYGAAAANPSAGAGYGHMPAAGQYGAAAAVGGGGGAGAATMAGYGGGYGGGFQQQQHHHQQQQMQPPPSQATYDTNYTGKQTSNRGHAPRHQPY